MIKIHCGVSKMSFVTSNIGSILDVYFFSVYNIYSIAFDFDLQFFSFASINTFCCVTYHGIRFILLFQFLQIGTNWGRLDKQYLPPKFAI